jgi:hypothetical protein
MPELNPQTATAAPGPGRSALLYNLAGIAVLSLLVAVGAAYLIDELGRSDTPPVATLADADPVLQTISGHELSIPRTWFRYGEQIRDGFTDQIDLRVQYAAPDATPHALDITLLPRSRARTSASLLDSVYLHQFDDQTLEGVPGLVGKPMLAQNGYGGERVWYDALSPNPFVAKCLEPVSEQGAAQCVRTVYLPSGIAAVYTFDASLLPSWRQFDAEIQRWLTPIGAW